MSVRATARRFLTRLPSGAHLLTPEPLRRELRHRLGRYYSWEEGFDWTPPALRPNEVTGAPDFVGIGVQKAGTTWWYQLICRHPGVSARATLPKERHFFAPFATRAFTDGDIDTYQRWFPHRKDTITGEWTPDYMCQPWVAPLMAAAAPRVRLLVLLRDPVERFRSRFAQVGDDMVNLGNMLARIVDGGFYAAQLSRWYDHFDASQILVLQYERCVADTAGQLALTYRFLDLADDFTPPAIDREVNVTSRTKVELAPDARRRLVDAYAGDVAELTELVPSLDLSLWRNFSADPAT
jgi:hypothetical protein